MTEDPHIIEIDSIVLDGVAHLRPVELRSLIAAELRRSVLGSDLPTMRAVAASEAAIAVEVAHAVDQTLRGGTGDA